MNNDIKCSIITVCYNSEATIERTIKSVLNQTYQNIEYIIVDGASTDGTLNIVKAYEAKFEGRMRVISEPDDGIYFAMNKGIGIASGQLIGMINSDDWYESDAVETMVNFYDNMSEVDRKYCILYGGMASWLGDEKKSYSVGNHENMGNGDMTISHPTCFVSKVLYEELGGYDTKYISASDYDFMLRMLKRNDVSFSRVDHYIANFSCGGMCSSGKAYYDLLKVRRAHGIISNLEYIYTVIKCHVYDIFVAPNKAGA